MKKGNLLVCVCLFMAALWSRSLASGGYLFLGALITIVLLWRKDNLAQRLMYLAAGFVSVLLVIKAVPLAVHWVPLVRLELTEQELRQYLGIWYDVEAIWKWKTVFTFLPELICGPLCCLEASSRGLPSRRTYPTLLSLTTIFLLLTLGVWICWWFNLAYLLLGCVWCVLLVWGREYEHWLSSFVMVLAAIQLGFTYTEHVMDLYQWDVYYESHLGVLDTHKHPIELILVLLIFFFSGLLSRYEEPYQRQSTDLSVPLLDEPRSSSKQLSGSQSIRHRGRTRTSLNQSDLDLSQMKKSFTTTTKSYELSFFPWVLQYLRSPEFSLAVVRLLVLVWVSHYQCLASLLAMVWLFASCGWYKEIGFIRKCMWTLLLPVLMVQMMVYYVYNVLYPQTYSDTKLEKYGFQSFVHPQMEFSLQVIIFAWTVFVADRLHETSKDDTPKSESLRAIINEVVYNMDKLSLCVLFLVGLSYIDLLHTILMVICSVFLLNMDRAKKGWKGLLVYTMFMLFGLYVWMLLLNLTDIELDNAYWWKIIGVETKTAALDPFFEFIPRNFLLWGLFFTEFTQMVVYDIQDIGHYANYEKEKVSVLLGPLLRIKQWIQHYIQMYQIWVMYGVILAVMVFSTQNVLNFLRFVLLMIFFVVHFNDVTLRVGRNKLKVVWFALKYFSGLILVLRYIYQFTYSSETEKDSDLNANLRLLGIEKYDVADLYKAMTWDSIIFLSSVLAERSLQPQREHQGEEPASHSVALLFIAELFGKSMMIGLCALAIFWRLSGSMLLIIICVLFFVCSAVNYHYWNLKNAYLTRIVVHIRDSELKLRQRAWDAIFLFCILFMLVDYGAFLIDPKYMLPEEYDSAIWIMFALGVNKPTNDAYLFSEMYGYLIILAVLVVEKHCVEYLKEHLNDQTEIKYELNPSFQVWNHFRVILEEAILMLILVTAFTKLTVVSLLYVFTVFFLCILKTENRKKLILLTYILTFSVFAQYFVILSNIRAEISQTPPPKVTNKPLPIPWFDSIEWGDPNVPKDKPHIEDDPTFLNLGTNVYQIYNISYDLMILIGILVYFEYVDEKRTDVANEPCIAPDQTSSEPKNTPFRIKVKNLFYSISHILVLVLVLIFVSQSNGLTSIIYCLFSLAFLMQANTLLNFNREWQDYTRFLDNYFVTFLMVDLSAIILYQMPLPSVHTGTGNEFLKALGLVSLWRAGDELEPMEARVHYDWVIFKIWTFIILRLLSKMFANDDFRQYIDDYRSDIAKSASRVSIDTAEAFNDHRIQISEEFTRKKQESNAMIEKMLQEAGEFYVKGKETSQIEVKGDSSPDIAVSVWLKSLLLDRLSKPLFSAFLKDKVKKTEKGGKQDEEHKESEPVLSASDLEAEASSINLTCKRLALLLWFIVCSHTQEICFVLFFLNHYFYASVESLFFPFSTLCYAMLDNPRPSARYWKLMLYYSVGVFCIKYSWQLNMVDLLITRYIDFSLKSYTDPYKIGFNLCSLTYSETLFYYTIWDVLCICGIICHEYILLKSGLSEVCEYNLESLRQAKDRHIKKTHSPIDIKIQVMLPPVKESPEYSREQSSLSRSGLEDYSDAMGIDRSRDESSFDQEGNSPSARREISHGKQFFLRLLPFDSEEKPGRDLYTYTISMQILILLCIVLLYTHMDGESQDISLAIK